MKKKFDKKVMENFETREMVLPFGRLFGSSIFHYFIINAILHSYTYLPIPKNKNPFWTGKQTRSVLPSRIFRE
jgi:hypothetical protein